MTDSTNTLNKIINGLNKVDNETNNDIMKMSKSMNSSEIISNFNQRSLDFFNDVITITKNRNKLKESGFEVYLHFLHQAIKADAKMPIDQFSMVVLEFASAIYDQDENLFLDMHIADSQIEGQFGNNEFSIIKSEKFKNLWRELNQDEKKVIKDHMIDLTISAHAYFFKTASQYS